ncbi:hypothetical protein ACFCVS_15560 [Bacillus altitudinis]|uniref:hypothetical protein n=1 Tax=Bacillus altitudinis TaxID=293387 RepID=UPI0009326940|nr:hypothetical protein [Bacillus altitudinis]OJT56121.1 hypothetical protein BFP48_14600 [Bacillus altitudinis]
MEFLDFFVLGAKAGADLPTLGGVKSWAKQLVEQAIYIVVIFISCKYLLKMSIGKILGLIVLASSLVFVGRNWSLVTGWVGALLKTF